MNIKKNSYGNYASVYLQESKKKLMFLSFSRVRSWQKNKFVYCSNRFWGRHDGLDFPATTRKPKTKRMGENGKKRRKLESKGGCMKEKEAAWKNRRKESKRKKDGETARKWIEKEQRWMKRETHEQRRWRVKEREKRNKNDRGLEEKKGDEN